MLWVVPQRGFLGPNPSANGCNDPRGLVVTYRERLAPEQCWIITSTAGMELRFSSPDSICWDSLQRSAQMQSFGPLTPELQKQLKSNARARTTR